MGCDQHVRLTGMFIDIRGAGHGKFDMGEPALSTLDTSTQGSSDDVGTLIGLLAQAADLRAGK